MTELHTGSSGETIGRVTFLGTGTSVGVPMIGCDCRVCRSDDLRNRRSRCAITVDCPDGKLLVDTPPELREQLLRSRIGIVHAVLFTHEHADHLHGLDDVRLFPFRLGGPVPLYCDESVERRIRRTFDYAFAGGNTTHAGSAPNLAFTRISPGERFPVLGTEVIPIPMQHGPRFDVLGFRFGDFAYCTDTNHIPPESMALLQGLDTFVVGALRPDPHPTHFNVDQAVEVARELNPRRTLLTHLSHYLDHQETCDRLPDGIDLAYDGMQIDVNLT